MFYLEVFLYLLFIPIILSNRLVYNMLLKVNKKISFAILLFLTALIIAQVLNNQKYSYPFAYWGMYSSVYADPEYREYKIKLQDGTIIRYPFREIAFTAPSIVIKKMESLKTRGEGKEVLEKTIKGLAAIYEKNHPRERIQHFIITQVRFNIDSKGDYTVKKEKLFEWEKR